MDVVPTTGAQQNSLAGNITSISGTGNMATVVTLDQNLSDTSKKLDDPPPNTGNGRFENGTIRIGTAGNVTATSDLEGNGTFYVQKTTGTGITIPCTVSKSGETDVTGNVISLMNNVFKINIASGTLTANFVGGTIAVGGMSMAITAVNDVDSTVTVVTLASIPANVVDDDDFNGNDAGNLHGDSGEDVAATTQTFSHMQDSDDPAANAFAPAYIRPVYDGGGNAANDTSNISFALNVTDNNTVIQNQLNLGRNSGSNESDSFWVVYVQVAYQEDMIEDFDPDTESPVCGVTLAYAVTDDVTNSAGVPRGADGSLVFVEAARDRARFPDVKPDVQAAPHEVGHQFGLKGDVQGFGLMWGGDTSTVFVDRHLNVLRWRIKSPGQP